MFGRTNTFTTCGESDTSRRKGGGEKSGEGGIREHIARRLLCATSRRAGGVNGGERGVWGIAGVGKLKAEAPRRRSGQPTPRCWGPKKKGKKGKIKRKRGIAETASPSVLRRVLRSREFANVRHSRSCVSKFNSSTKKRPDKEIS